MLNSNKIINKLNKINKKKVKLFFILIIQGVKKKTFCLPFLFFFKKKNELFSIFSIICNIKLNLHF